MRPGSAPKWTGKSVPNRKKPLRWNEKGTRLPNAHATSGSSMIGALPVIDSYLCVFRQANRGKGDPPPDGLDWWERTPNGNSRASRARSRAGSSGGPGYGQPERIPPPAPGTFDSFDTMQVVVAYRCVCMNCAQGPLEPPRRTTPLERRQSVESRHSYRPSSTTQRNEKTMRQLSAMRERTDKEQRRVKHAIKSDQYDADVFSDNDSDPDIDGLLARKINKPKVYKKPNMDDDDDDDAPSLMHRKGRTTHVLTDAPLARCKHVRLACMCNLQFECVMLVYQRKCLHATRKTVDVLNKKLRKVKTPEGVEQPTQLPVRATDNSNKTVRRTFNSIRAYFAVGMCGTA
ncbi:unnamed protein product [Sphagnum balticum]